MAAKLATPRLSVVLYEGDDQAIEVQVINADMVLAEVTGRKHGWGKIGDSAIRYQTFFAWAALRRKHLIADDLGFDEFEKTCASIMPIDADDQGRLTNAADFAVPTLPDLVSG